LISGWSAWTWLEGRKAKPEHVLEVLPAIEAFHAALAQVPYAPHLTEQAGLADRAAWDDEPIPSGLPPELAGPVERLATLRRPLPDLRNQVIHGDLNYHNILIARTSARYGTTNAHSSSLASLGYGLRGTVSMPPPPQPPRHAR
jgi:Ser/Thr protein kinase RdoA (MazF antagonist)